MAAAARRAAGVELGFGDDGERFGRVEDETFVQRRDAERQAARASQKTGKVGARVRLEAVFGEEAGERLAPAGAFGEQQHAAAECIDE